MPTKAVELPSIEYLEECFEVDYETGIVLWKHRPLWHFRTEKGWSIFKSRFAGKVAGHLHKADEYVNVVLGGSTYRLHRIIYKMYTRSSIPESKEVDHLDGNRSNNCISNLKLKVSEKNARNRSLPENNSSGIIGVQYMYNRRNVYWQACWSDLVTGKRRSKYFSIAKLGHDEAFRLACLYRAKMITELNAQGAGYTERHGT